MPGIGSPYSNADDVKVNTTGSGGDTSSGVSVGVGSGVSVGVGSGVSVGVGVAVTVVVVVGGVVVGVCVAVGVGVDVAVVVGGFVVCVAAVVVVVPPPPQAVKINTGINIRISSMTYLFRISPSLFGSYRVIVKYVDAIYNLWEKIKG
ncbi:MAG: hypothetical protein A2Y58_02975 [Chloroflexi bacterium RBG_13_51_52]|nr:MAG: hypothetical protein A2Y58_02975 [Chloroflexi bacterium RBG_13_51_52]